jgi:hypothetical protein
MGVEPINSGFADHRLTAWLRRQKKWSGKRGSNPRQLAWKANALPTELFPPISRITKTLSLAYALASEDGGAARI